MLLPSRPPPASEPQTVSDDRRALIVDDDPDSAELLLLLLGKLGWNCRIAYGASTALVVATEFLPHAALVDVELPGMDGIALLEALRAKEELVACRFIAVTGFSADDLERRSKTVRFDAHLRKPFDFAELGCALAHCAANAANGYG